MKRPIMNLMDRGRTYTFDMSGKTHSLIGTDKTNDHNWLEFTVHNDHTNKNKTARIVLDKEKIEALKTLLKDF